MRKMSDLTLELKDARVDVNGDEYYLINYGNTTELFLVYLLKNQLWQMAQFGENKEDVGYQIFREVTGKLEIMRQKMNAKLLDSGGAKEDTKGLTTVA